jgi:hypothetical protein
MGYLALIERERERVMYVCEANTAILASHAPTYIAIVECMRTLVDPNR